MGPGPKKKEDEKEKGGCKMMKGGTADNSPSESLLETRGGWGVSGGLLSVLSLPKRGRDVVKHVLNYTQSLWGARDEENLPSTCSEAPHSVLETTTHTMEQTSAVRDGSSGNRAETVRRGGPTEGCHCCPVTCNVNDPAPPPNATTANSGPYRDPQGSALTLGR